MDTETLLAMLSSLIYPMELEQAVLLDALIRSHGDIEAAASSLRAEPPRKKRKTSSRAGLDGWLQRKEEINRKPAVNPKRPSNDFHAEAESSSSIYVDASQGIRTVEGENPEVILESPRKPLSKVKPVSQSELMALLLRTPKFSDNTPRPQVPKQLPLTLVSREHVAEHTPCTLHKPVLPPELACRYGIDNEGSLHSHLCW